MYYSIANTFAKGNFPILSPWQPDLYVAYHYGTSIFMGAGKVLTGVHLDVFHRLLPLILIHCMIELLTYGLQKPVNFISFLFSQIIVLVGLICFGGFMIVILHLPFQFDFSLLLHPLGWLRTLPTISQTMDSYGLPSRLDMMIYQLHHAVGLANFFLILFISLYGKTKAKLFWVILGINLAVLAIINETVFPSAIATSFFILFIMQNKDKNIFRFKNLKLILFFAVVGIVSIFQGGMITDNLFRNKNLDSGLAFTTYSQLPEKLHYVSQRTTQILPITNEWLPFQWIHIDFIPMYICAFVLLFILKFFFKDKNFTKIISLILAGFVSNFLYYFVTVKFLPSDGNRFLTFTYVFVGVAIAFEIVLILNYLFSKKFIYGFLFIIPVIWILLPSVLPYIANFYNIQHKQNFFFESQYQDRELPPLIPWLTKNIPVKDRVLDLAVFANFITEDKQYYGNWANGFGKPITSYAGVLTPYWDGKYQAYMYTPGPDYLNILYTLNPSSLKKLKVNYLVIDKNYLASLPRSRQKDLENNNYFTKVFIDDKTITNYWVGVYKVSDQYLSEGKEIDHDIYELDKIIPQKAVVYLDNTYEPYSWMQIRNAGFLVLNNREIVFNPIGGSGYGFLGVQLRHRYPVTNDHYDYLYLKRETNPKSVCNCAVKKIWEGYQGKAIAWKVLK